MRTSELEASKDLDRLRGLLTGLVLSDALGIAGPGAASAGSIRIGAAGQLTCFIVDALIRAHCREVDKGIGTDRSVLVWLTQRRWARLQGLSVSEADNDFHSERHTDDWLAQVPAFVERRGAAPAAAAAVASSRSAEEVRRESRGAHGLIRSLPFAVSGVTFRAAHWFDQARDVAQLPHAPVSVTRRARHTMAGVLIGCRQRVEGRAAPQATGGDPEHVVRDPHCGPTTGRPSPTSSVSWLRIDRRGLRSRAVCTPPSRAPVLSTSRTPCVWARRRRPPVPAWPPSPGLRWARPTASTRSPRPWSDGLRSQRRSSGWRVTSPSRWG